MFLHLPLIVGYNSRKFGITLSGRNYMTCRGVLAAASLGEVAGLTVIFSGVLYLSCLVNKEWTMYCCEQ